jgi:hypothetical protein
MTLLKITAAVLFLGFAFFKVGQFIVREWKKIEREEEARRQTRSRIRVRGGY